MVSVCLIIDGSCHATMDPDYLPHDPCRLKEDKVSVCPCPHSAEYLAEQQIVLDRVRVRLLVGILLCLVGYSLPEEN